MGEVKKTMFQGVAFHFEQIFGPLTIPKCGLGEFEKVMFHVLEWYSQLAENAI